jgi:DNA polymerase
MGATRFRQYCASGPLGLDPIYMSIEEAYDTVNKYRESNYHVKNTWSLLGQRINQMTVPGLHEKQKCIIFGHEHIQKPSGTQLLYPGLMQTEEGQWVYGIDKKTKFIFGGSLLENLVQSLARDIVAEQMLVISEKYRIAGMCHDEILYLAPEEEAEEALAFGIEVFSRSPSWAPDLPVSAEGAYAKYYCK